MPRARPIQLVFNDASLAAALATRLRAATGRCVEIVPDFSAHAPSAIVITTATRCTPVECAGIAQNGQDVIILASLPSHFQQEAYEMAGAAAYLPMVVDLQPLLEVITRLNRAEED